MINIMCDIESLALTSDTIIPQIAMIAFSDDYHTVNSYTNTISMYPQILKGRVYDQSVVDWWNTQPEDVQTLVFSGYASPTDVYNNIVTFLTLMKEKHGDIHFWANGLLFDVNAVNSFMTDFGEGKTLDSFVKYNAFHDFRTLRNAAKTIDGKRLFDLESNIEIKGAKHNALADCLWQIKSLEAVTKILNTS